MPSSPEAAVWFNSLGNSFSCTSCAALGMGGEWSLGVALVMESWSAHARPVLAGLIGAAADFGFLVVSLVGLALNPDEYWRVILVVCVLPALLTFFFRMFVPESKSWEHASATMPRPGLGAIFVPGLRHRSLLGAGLGAVALLATWGAVQWIALWVGQVSTRRFRRRCTPLADLFRFGGDAGIFSGAMLGSGIAVDGVTHCSA